MDTVAFDAAKFGSSVSSSEDAWSPDLSLRVLAERLAARDSDVPNDDGTESTADRADAALGSASTAATAGGKRGASSSGGRRSCSRRLSARSCLRCAGVGNTSSDAAAFVGESDVLERRLRLAVTLAGLSAIPPTRELAGGSYIDIF